MNEEVRTEIINDLAKTAEILEIKEVKDLEELRNLSEQTIEHIAIHKDLELVSVTVLIYSLYKIENCLQKTDRSQIVEALRRAGSRFNGLIQLGPAGLCRESPFAPPTYGNYTGQQKIIFSLQVV